MRVAHEARTEHHRSIAATPQRIHHMGSSHRWLHRRKRRAYALQPMQGTSHSLFQQEQLAPHEGSHMALRASRSSVCAYLTRSGLGFGAGAAVGPRDDLAQVTVRVILRLRALLIRARSRAA